jgi:hypothetical protein
MLSPSKLRMLYPKSRTRRSASASTSTRMKMSWRERKPKSHLARLARELLAEDMQAARMVYAIPGRWGEHRKGGD